MPPRILPALTLLLSCGALAALYGCGRSNAEDKSKIRLTVWSMWNGQEEKNFQQVLDRYQELHPNVVIDSLPGVRDDTKTIRAIVAGTPPDVFTLADPLYLGPLVANDALYRMDDWFHASGLREADFVPTSLTQCRADGGLYAMPYLIDDSALLWNKKSFRDAGLDPDRPPKTLEEFQQYVARLTKKDANGRITRLGLLPPDDIYVINRLFGGSLYDSAKGVVTPDSPENIAALTWYCNLIKSMGPWDEVNGFKASFGNTQSPDNPFYTGKVAMMINGEWNPYWAHRYAPNFEYGVAPLPPPSAHPERAGTTWLGGNMFCIPNGSAHPKEAWDLLVWMQSDEAQVLYAGLNNNVPNQRSALKSPALRTGAPYKEKFGIFLDLSDSPNAAAFPALPVSNLYNAELFTARDLALSGDKTPADALRDVRVRVQRELDRYGRK